MKPEISYIVVSFNSEKHITNCLTSILNQSKTNYEIIVVDNNSQDNTASIIEDFSSKDKQIKLIKNNVNIGYGNAISKAAEHTEGEFLAILNADTVLDKLWAEKLLDAFSSDEKIMSASGTVYFLNNELQSTGGMMDKYGAVIQRENKMFYSRKISARTFFYNDGSSFMIRHNILQEITFDPMLFLYYEDVDLSWKIRMLNYKVEYIPTAISYHDMGHSYSDITLSKFYYISRNRIYVCQKNYSLKNIVCRIPIMIFLIFFSSIFYDISKKPMGYTKNFFKAILWNVTNFGFMIKERKKIRSINKISDGELDHYLIQKSIELSLFRNKI